MYSTLVAVVCGPPCSGKTTFVKNLKTRLENLQVTKNLTDQKEVQDVVQTDIIDVAANSKNFENVVFLSYDNLMPFEINNSIIKQSISVEEEEDHSSYCYVEDNDEHMILASHWKQHRNFILELLDCFLKEHNVKKLEKNIDEKFSESHLKHAKSIIQNFLSAFSDLRKKQTDSVKCSKNNEKSNESVSSTLPRDGGILILLDDNMWLQSMRKKVFNICRENSISYAQIYVSTSSIETLLKRNKRRNVTEKVDEDTIKKMMNTFEVPNNITSSKENDEKNDLKHNTNWEQYSYCILNDDDDEEEEVEGDVVDEKFPYNSVIQLLKKSLNNPYHPPTPPLSPELARSVCLNNLVHQVDLILRKTVKEHLDHIKSNNEKEALQKHAKILSQCKNQVITDIKNRLFLWPLPLANEVTDVANQPNASIYKNVQNYFFEKLKNM